MDMENKQGLNDIILDQDNNKMGGLKKIALAVATLSILLIIVVVAMNLINSKSNDSMPKPILPPTPEVTEEMPENDPLFEPIETKKGDTADSNEQLNDNLKKITAKLKQEEQNIQLPQKEITPPKVEENIVEEEPQIVVPKAYQPKTEPVIVKTPVNKPVPAPKKETKQEAKNTGGYFIQVGSFERLTPNDKFIKKIESNEYNYIIHDAVVNGKAVKKLLIGPFKSRQEAKDALPAVKERIVSGAYIIKV